jgi:hypothetical protein
MLTHLRLTDGAILGTAPAEDNPQEMAFDGSHIWVGTWEPASAVLRLRPKDGTLQRSFLEGGGPEGILFDGTNIWIAYYGSYALCKITPAP